MVSIKKINLLEAFDNVIIILKCLGYWRISGNIVYTVYKYIVITTCCIHTSTCITYAMQYIHSDPEKTYETLAVAAGGLEGLIKQQLFLRSYKKITDSWNDMEHEEFQPKNNEQTEILKNYIKMSKIVIKMYFWVYVLCTFVMAVFAWLSGKDFPSNHWVPFEYHKPFLFQIIYLYVIFGFCCAGFTNCSVDLCFYLSLGQITAQCDILANTLRNIHDLKKLNVAHKVTIYKNKDEVMNDVLAECVQHYNRILKFSVLIADAFKEIVTFQFIPSVLMICFAMFKVSSVDTSSGIFFQILFFQLGATCEIFLYCFFGDQVTTTSEELFYAAFESEWYNASQKFKKNLLTMMIMVQKPIVFYSWDIFAVNYEAFKSIMQKSWSICIALKSTQDLNQ